MKTGYEKPQIQFTSFELSQSISAGCELISNQSKGTCAVAIPEWGNMTLYVDGSCDMTTATMEDTFCYHAPGDNNNVYSS